MPLRANLVVLDNIAIVPQYHQNMPYQKAADIAWNLLLAVERTGIAEKRDPQLTHEERFLAKLLRATIRHSSLLIIDRPALLLPDTHYPPFVATTLSRLEAHLNACWILDYPWNKPLYNLHQNAHH
jgi:hypothetical protein